MFHIIAFLIVGLLAGWIAGKVTEGHGFGVAGDLVVGVIGAFVGGFLFGLIQIHLGGFVGDIIKSSVGAVVFLWLLRRFRRKSPA